MFHNLLNEHYDPAIFVFLPELGSSENNFCSLLTVLSDKVINRKVLLYTNREELPFIVNCDI